MSEGLRMREEKSKKLLAIRMKQYKQLDGTCKTQFAYVGDEILRRFDKTEFPANDDMVVCPHFILLAWANGCSYNCSWCFLKGTFRFRGQHENGRVPLEFKDRDRVGKHIEAFLAAKDLPAEIIDTGELSDCYDAATEILTLEGWKYFKDLTEKDNVATLSNEGFLEYQKPERIIIEDYAGQMYRLKTQEVSLFVTLNHKLLIAKRKYEKTKDIGFGEFSLQRAKETFGKRVKHKKNCKWRGYELTKQVIEGRNNARYQRHRENIEISGDVWLEFLGYYLSEGSTTVNDKTSAIVIAQRKKSHPEQYEKIKQCLSKVPFRFKELTNGDGFVCHNVNFANYLLQFGKAEDKYVPRKMLFVSSRQLKILYDALMLGDGSGCTYSTTSKRLADDVQEILLKIGLAGNIWTKNQKGHKSNFGTANYDLYNVCAVTKYIEPVINHGHRSGSEESIQNYIGKIYCVTVPNHIVYVRRDGKAVWSGNSLADEGKREVIPFSEWIMAYFVGTKHKVLFLTKSTSIEKFLEHRFAGQWQKNAILAWSVNAPEVAERWEKYAPPSLTRLDAAKRAYDAGYEVRLRIDPMVPVENWREQYGLLVDEIYKWLKPSVITLGTLRGLQTTIIYAKDKSWVPYLTDKSNWGKKMPHKQRLEMYQYVIAKIRSYDRKVNIGICKETLGMHKALGINPAEMHCNCVW